MPKGCIFDGMGSIAVRSIFAGEIGGTGAERVLYRSEFCDGGSGGTVCAPDSILDVHDLNLTSISNEHDLGRYYYSHYYRMRSLAPPR